MDTMKKRNVAKAILLASLLLMLLVLGISVFAPWWLLLILTVIAVLLVISFIVITLVYWRCPHCGLRFKMYDMELEQTGICPRCGERFAESPAVEHIGGEDDGESADASEDGAGGEK